MSVENCYFSYGEEMSRVGKLPISIPKGVKVEFSNSMIKLEGPKGILTQKISEGLNVVQEKDEILITRAEEGRKLRALHGLSRTLVSNMVLGVSQGFQKALEISGVGYKAEVKGERLVLNLGHSHPTDFLLPQGITAKVDKQKIIIEGISKELVGQVAAKIRNLRKVEPYKGKRIKYSDEAVRRKIGKGGKK